MSSSPSILVDGCNFKVWQPSQLPHTTDPVGTFHAGEFLSASGGEITVVPPSISADGQGSPRHQSQKLTYVRFQVSSQCSSYAALVNYKIIQNLFVFTNLAQLISNIFLHTEIWSGFCISWDEPTYTAVLKLTLKLLPKDTQWWSWDTTSECFDAAPLMGDQLVTLFLLDNKVFCICSLTLPCSSLFLSSNCSSFSHGNSPISFKIVIFVIFISLS